MVRGRRCLEEAAASRSLGAGCSISGVWFRGVWRLVQWCSGAVVQ